MTQAADFATFTEITFIDAREIARLLQLAGQHSRAARNLGNTDREDAYEGLRHSLAGCLEAHSATGRSVGWFTDDELPLLHRLGLRAAPAPADTPIPARAETLNSAPKR